MGSNHMSSFEEIKFWKKVEDEGDSQTSSPYFHLSGVESR